MTALKGFFITGTDTGIGKTWVGSSFILALRQQRHTVVGMKPVASGCIHTPEGLRNEDALVLQSVSSISAPYETINPYAFEPPIAPHIAAHERGVEITFSEIRGCAESLMQSADYLIVEGVGGWRVPLSHDGDVAALAATLGLPVLLVVGIRLGCINHAVLTAEAVKAKGVPLAGWIANLIDPHMERLAANVAAIRDGISAPCLGLVPFMRARDPALTARYLNLESL